MFLTPNIYLSYVWKNHKLKPYLYSQYYTKSYLEYLTIYLMPREMILNFQ